MKPKQHGQAHDSRQPFIQPSPVAFWYKSPPAQGKHRNTYKPAGGARAVAHRTPTASPDTLTSSPAAGARCAGEGGSRHISDNNAVHSQGARTGDLKHLLLGKVAGEDGRCHFRPSFLLPPLVQRGLGYGPHYTFHRMCSNDSKPSGRRAVVPVACRTMALWSSEH